MTTTFRWGILGTGRIAGEFAEGLTSIPDARIAAVGSRTHASAERFGRSHGSPRCHGSYRELAEDPDVDAIYVATPHPLHRENTLLCLEQGKPVLCEKPFAMNASEARSMVATARDRKTFLLEAMWTRFSPVMARVRSLLHDGALGEVRQLHADFGFRTDVDPGGRLFDRALGGGALLDVGVYCASLAQMVFGEVPRDIQGLAHLGSTGVDEQCAWIQRYGGGQLAILSAAIRTETAQGATIYGSEGSLHIPEFWHPDRLLLGEAEERFEVQGNGYQYQALEVQRCVREGLTESPMLPLDESIEVMETLDRIRSPWGLRYNAD